MSALQRQPTIAGSITSVNLPLSAWQLLISDDQGEWIVRTLNNAIAPLEDALAIIDESGSNGDIGGHVDLALARLRERLGIPVAFASGVETPDQLPGALN